MLGVFRLAYKIFGLVLGILLRVNENSGWEVEISEWEVDYSEPMVEILIQVFAFHQGMVGLHEIMIHNPRTHDLLQFEIAVLLIWNTKHTKESKHTQRKIS